MSVEKIAEEVATKVKEIAEATGREAKEIFEEIIASVEGETLGSKDETAPKITCDPGAMQTGTSAPSPSTVNARTDEQPPV